MKNGIDYRKLEPKILFPGKYRNARNALELNNKKNDLTKKQ